MHSISQLTDFYYKELYPILEELEQERKALKKQIIVVTGVYFFFLSLIFWYLFAQSISVDTLLFVAFTYIGGATFIYKFLTQDYTHKFKEQIIQPLIKKIDARLRYTKNLHVPSRHIYASTLFPSHIDRISGNDYVSGSIEGVPIEFSDIHLEKRVKSSKNKETWHTIFQGLFIVSEFPKKFHGITYVLPDTAQSLFGDYLGSLLQKNNFFAKGELVTMDSPAFEKEFVVYSSDQIEARYILTPALMEKILHFKKRAKTPLSIAFYGKNIYLAIEYNKDLFEPSVFHSLLKYKIAMEYIQTLHLAIGIVQELKLNQKLWSTL